MLRKSICFVLVCTFVLMFNHDVYGQKKQLDFVKYVNTLIGTKPWEKEIQLAAHELGQGHTYPGVCAPFAKIEWTPQTSVEMIPYWYEEDDPKIQGFRGTHYPSGAVVSEYGAFTILPMVKNSENDPEKRASLFRHETEIAKPHYYSVFLDDYSVKAELTGNHATGLMRFTFPESKESSILIDFYKDKGEVFFDPVKNEIRGYSLAKGLGSPENFKSYFVIKIDKKVTDSKVTTTKNQQGKILRVNFETDKDEIVNLQIGTSFISFDQAYENIETEIGNKDFQTIASETKAKWNKELNKIIIEDDSEENKTIFYTALYHSLLLPRNTTENGKYFSFFDGKVHEGNGYTDYSLWDTFRSLHPLLIFLDPDRVNQMIDGLLNIYDEGGWMPKWPNPGYANIMMGTHADAVIADAYVKGIESFDIEKAYEAMLKNANVKGDRGFAGRVGIEDYNKLGFVPMDRHGESVARTLEFAYNDFCISQVAKKMGKEEDYKEYSRRAAFYKNVLDPESKLVRGRYTTGQWAPQDDHKISTWSGNTKAQMKNYLWNHTFLVPHDVEGLKEFFGDDQSFSNALDTLFHKNLYFVGDEFSMHAPYLYNNIRRPWKTQKLIREILTHYFTAEPSGLCGNDDCGQLSAWYIFGAMGFYPVAPGNTDYNITSPLFKKVTMNLPNGKKFVVRTENNSDENYYIQKIKLNGKDYKKTYINHSDIMSGGEIVFLLGNKPNMNFGVKDDEIPLSRITRVETEEILFVPEVKTERTSFYNSTVVELNHIYDDVKIYYTINGDVPTVNDNLYNKPLEISEKCNLKVKAFRSNSDYSEVVSVDFHRIPEGRKVQLNSKYASKYSGGGELALIDYKRGGEDFMSGFYQGYEAEDFEAVIDLGKPQNIKRIGAGFLQDLGPWIFFPEKIKFYTSTDGKTFNLIKETNIDHKQKPLVSREYKEFFAEIKNEIRYIKIKAENLVSCPDWHDFAGNKSWIFVDEIIIEE